MRLDFNVLWLDDQPASIKSYSDKLGAAVRRQGFELIVKNARSVAEAKAVVRDSVFSDSLDLVLVDFDLGAAETGAMALAELRAHVGYREIVFYSAKPVSELRRLAYEQNVEGIYCSTRDGLVETAQGVFDVLTKKILDLDHSRGIVMGATSDIDNVVHEALLALHAGQDSAGQAAFLVRVVKKVKEKVEASTAKANGAGSRTLEELLGDYDLLTANDRLRLMANGLESSVEFALARKKIATYLNEVVPKRNLLGHVVATETDQGRVLASKDGRRLSEEDLRQLRCNLLEHRDNFDDVLSRLKSAKKK